METWKDIPGYEGSYQVSDLGNVRSVDRIVSGTYGNRCIKGKVLSPSLANDGYAKVRLYIDGAGGRTVRVHKLVALTFIGPCLEGMTVCHGTLGKQTNTPTNLSYGTLRQNQFDRYRDGTVTCKPVRRSDGTVFRSVRDAARLTGVAQKSISSICNKKWLHHGGRRQFTAGGYTWEFV